MGDGSSSRAWLWKLHCISLPPGIFQHRSAIRWLNFCTRHARIVAHCSHSRDANSVSRIFFHELVRRINIWVFCLLGGPFLGPFVVAWLITAVNWRADFDVLAGLHGFSTILVVLLGDETLYDRHNPQPRQKGIWGKMKCILGITSAKAKGRPDIWTMRKNLLSTQIRPQIFFITVIYVVVLVACVIGVNVTISLLVAPPPYSFSASDQALSWIAPMVHISPDSPNI